MKNFYLLVVFTLISNAINAQTKLDSMLVNVDKSTVTSGIIYERVTQFANLYNFNKPNYSNTADYKYLRQALNELHNASNQTRLISLQELENRIASTTQENHLDVAILNSTFQILNYNFENPNSGGLLLNETTQKFNQITNTPPFYSMQTSIVAPTKSIVKGHNAEFIFNENLFLENGENDIKTLTIDFGSITKTIISNGDFLAQNVIIPYNSSGTKELNCQITFNDNTTLITNGSFYFHYIPNTPSVNSLNGLCTASNTRTKDDYVIAEETFKGYKTNDPTIFPRIDYRIFYADESFHSDLNMYKPVIIIDGFDPGDKRKIQDCDCEEDPKCAAANLSNGVFDPNKHKSMVDFQAYDDENNENANILTKLRTLGYDVILVNQPTYETTNLDNNQQVTIDGGAYYIESNALALVALIKKIKLKLAEVNSDEEIAIVGPSMGGQISRYALSYMEKKYADTNDEDWNHNTGLWVSVDSPHLGANIPVGDQALIYLASSIGDSDSANDFYMNQLGSVAAKQQLIEFHRNVPSLHSINENNLNGKVASQGYSNDDGSLFYRTYYNNLEDNGLPNSHGYPQNLRKIALINGSLKGKTIGYNSEKVLNIRGFQRVDIDLPWPFGSINFKVHIASLESHFMPSFGSGYKRVARFKAGFRDFKLKSPNINSRDNMDIVPGGYFNAQNDIATSILGTSPIDGAGGSFWEFPGDNIIYWLSSSLGDSEFELRDFRPNHSFIPSFSAIAHKNPDQSWLNSLDYNLICSDETYFDSYFGHDENTQHTSFTKESAQWLFEELAGNEQTPYYPLDNTDLHGDSAFCLDEVRTFYFGTCKLPSQPTWFASLNLEILEIDNNNQSITVKALSNGNGHIIATIEDGRSFSKNIFIGVPDVLSVEKINKIKTGLSDPIATFNSCDDIAIKLNMQPSNNEVSEVEWQQVSTNFTWSVSNNEFAIISPQCNGKIQFKVRMRNNCGWSRWKTINFDIKHCTKKCNKIDAEGSITSNNFVIYPVPADTVLNVKLANQSAGLLQYGEGLVIKLFTSSGWMVYEANAIATLTTINVSSLASGVYTLVLNYEGVIETHQIIIQ
ncbi:T9SS type A sorting domain-containing protein [Psychroserpens ponticola]|uniref:T9SS type A sorting domain-containing protein n=1 Tax=Psychroserpens ponticola TaxID=2932268 RepID=A0ABY7RVZ8_9FLAO|nr:T9SS type A sorting domain-containing protein [Psychroserpens ponticola]WCO01114.1 T9SS type A sorting domain-containing protein [Psychroserpens ponticola]